jgi:hypothetical protein
MLKQICYFDAGVCVKVMHIFARGRADEVALTIWLAFTEE